MFMDQLEEDEVDANVWLEREAKSTWARSHFDIISKCDAITNNFNESFNAWILKIRDKPLINFVDKYSLAVMGLLHDRRLLSMEMDDNNLIPAIVLVIKKLERKFPSCILMTFRICRYCSPYYHVNTFRATYAGWIFPFDNVDEWGKVMPGDEVLPPSIERKARRPRKQRIRGDDEERATSKRKCIKCGVEAEGENVEPIVDVQQQQEDTQVHNVDDIPKATRGGRRGGRRGGSQNVNVDQPPNETQVDNVQQNVYNEILRGGSVGRKGGRGGGSQNVNVDQPPNETQVDNVQQNVVLIGGGRGGSAGRRGGRGGIGRATSRGVGWWIRIDEEEPETPSTPGPSNPTSALREELATTDSELVTVTISGILSGIGDKELKIGIGVCRREGKRIRKRRKSQNLICEMEKRQATPMYCIPKPKVAADKVITVYTNGEPLYRCFMTLSIFNLKAKEWKLTVKCAQA
ncbi:hypothetical protein IFM89_026645 [Coptis chinensis]|uniref:Uncharacterized protein n=1 Tax=Coptis chinensis TaxID=261450 RepID=A0A835H8J1_9MAGN|nr:hypothetical protein IFM89_026645 [Coptis chinensis]